MISLDIMLSFLIVLLFAVALLYLFLRHEAKEAAANGDYEPALGNFNEGHEDQYRAPVVVHSEGEATAQKCPH